ncbi:hypothetical protein [Chengkuizengella marina]|uniref:Uncharacterized protein n=1 Tax=Chengkuizengella marina TaxID=2507566 RepID=A0A6N9Q0E0_9BACL|nr:hypothetical protein [Chengkuizengella marina]NBI28582.1 hypothetical protein [Chengkuizengella marina]
MNMKVIKWSALPTLVGGGLIIFFKESLKSILADLLNVIHPILYYLVSWISHLEPPTIENNIISFFSILGIVIIVYLLMVGIYTVLKSVFYSYFWKKEVISQSVFGKEVAAVINAIDHQHSSINVNDKLVTLMTRVHDRVKEIFNFDNGNFQVLWITPDDSDENGEDFLLTYLEDEVVDSITTNALVRTCLIQNDPRFVLKYVEDIVPSSQEIQQFAIVKNYGKFRLGLAIISKEKEVFNTENIEQFNDLTSYFLLLGFNTKFCEEIKNKAEQIS